MTTRVVSDSDSCHGYEGLGKLIPGGNGFHPHPPPIAHSRATRPRTRGPRTPEVLPKEGQRGFQRTFHADVKHAP